MRPAPDLDEPSGFDAFVAKLKARDRISAEEEAALRGLPADERDIGADRIVVRARQRLSESLLLLEGMMCRFKDLPNGKRQIAELNVAGDFVDLHGFTLEYLDHDIMSLTPCRIAAVPHAALRELGETHPRLVRILWFLTNLDAAIHREWELSLGRRSAIGRLAHLLCELRARLALVGLADDKGFDLPLTQAELAECLGLTQVHINRTLRELREAGVLDIRGGRVDIRDLAALERVADFDPYYLYLQRGER